jgi:hypothetical protein
MKLRSLFTSIFAVLAIAAAGFVFGSDGTPREKLEVILGAGIPAAIARPGNWPWNRKIEAMKTFNSVAASTIASCRIPRYARTIYSMILQLGGTTFAKTDITRIELFLGSKSIFGPVSGTEMQRMNRWQLGPFADDDANFLPIDFTFPNVKEIGGEQLGGLELTLLPEGDLTLEVEIGAGATAPTLQGVMVWGNPSAGGDLAGLMTKYIRRVYPQFPAGDNFPDVQLRGALLARQFCFYTVATAGTSSAFGISGGANTGTGAMGAITVSAGTPLGRYKLRIIEPAANAGTFVVTDPWGRDIGAGTVAVAFSAGGLAFTLADAVDYVAGDGFNIDIGKAQTLNLTNVEIKKNEDVWWSMNDQASRFRAARYGRCPLSQLYVVDFLGDNHIDSILDTASAKNLDYKLNFTSADTLTLISQVIARPLAT